MNKNDALCITAKCGTTGLDFYKVYYLAYDGVWVLAYGKKELPKNSVLEGESETLSVDLGKVRKGPQFRCPHCGNSSTFVCWHCGKETCYDGNIYNGKKVTCKNCGVSAEFKVSYSENESDSTTQKNRSIEGLPIEGQ